MATQRTQSRERRASTQNPFTHVPFSAGDLAGVDITGGGGREFVPVTAQYRVHLAATAVETQQALGSSFREYPDVPAVVVFKLREEAIAKSHRPLSLAAEAQMPSVGHGALDEMLVAANPVTLQLLQNLIRTRSTKAIKSNLSAIERVFPWDVQRRLPPALRGLAGDALQIPLRASGRLMLRLFRHLDDNVTLHVLERMQQLLNEWNVPSQRILQRVGPPLLVVGADATVSAQALDAIVAFPGLRSVFPEPQASVIPALGADIFSIPDGVFDPPPDNAPVVAVFDTGVHPNATDLAAWIESTDAHVTHIDTDYVHGTCVASLVANARNLNGAHEWLPPTRCKVHDVCALESASGYVSDLILRLRAGLANRPDVRVWNLSLGIPTGITGDTFSEFAQELDTLSDQYGVLFVVAAGNYNGVPRRGWPHNEPPVLEDRLSSPADSVRALSVGAIAHLGTAASYVQPGEPACYSRRGPGPVFTPKPDLVHVGGGVDAPFTTDQCGLIVLAPNNTRVRSAGTSFAAPIVAAMAAHTWQAMDVGVGRRTHALDVTPTMVKALLIHAAEVSSPARTPRERRYFGSGWSLDPLSALYDADDSFTLMFEAELAGNMKWRKTPYPIPASLLVGGKLKAEVIITAVYAPPLDSNAGSEYVRANVELGFGVLAPDDDGVLQFKGRVPMEGETGTTGYEQQQVEHGGKWSPVKVLRRTFPQGVSGLQWALQASMMRRAFEPPMAEPLRVVIIVTLRSLSGQTNVYAEGLQALSSTNWVHQQLPAHVPVHV